MTCFFPKKAVMNWVTTIDETTGEVKKFRKPKFFYDHYDQVDELADNITMIPCGKCLGCRVDKANDWATRCTIEAKNWPVNCFITLTYNNENLPKNRSLIKKDCQNFFKRLRKKHKGVKSRTWKGKEEYPIRYFICGEYGPKTLRPHYHAGIFNWRPTDLEYLKENLVGDKLYTSKELEKIWKKGFITVGDLTYESAAYIARYVMKKAFKEHKALEKWMNKKGRQKEFVETSRNGGIGYMATSGEEFEKMKRNAGLFVTTKNGQKLKKIPNFLRKKWREIDNEEYYQIMGEDTKRKKEEIKKVLEKTDLTPMQYRAKQYEAFKQKAKLLKRCNIN